MRSLLCAAVFLCILFTLVSTTPYFLQDFESDSWRTKWTIISNEKYTGGWDVETAKEAPVEIANNKGLVVQNLARHHAIISKLSTPFAFDNTNNKPLVIQYEVKLQNGLECGGAYIKLISQKDLDEGAKGDLTKFGADTNYMIMFGPDRCGQDSKVHFIFRHQNPLTKNYEEKHVINPPPVPMDQRTHIYTLVIYPNNSFSEMVDLEDYRVGDLLDDFAPPVNPPATIDDPTDIKPIDWVDDEHIPDPTASKPADWDEDAPEEIPDLDVEMPVDWLEEEDEEVPDPDAVMPEDWIEEEDGEWSPPLVPNPKCEEVSGCGKWETPTMPNPEYRGKWRAPLIPNPAYKGEWVARQIPNPNYYHDAHPTANFLPISAVGIEIWTMTDGIMFDNFYIGDDLEEALEIGRRTWGEKVGPETRLEKEKEDGIESLMDKILDFFEGQNAMVYVVVTLVLGLLTSVVFFFTCLKSDPVVIQPRDQVLLAQKKKKNDGEGKEEKEEEEEKESVSSTDEGLKKRKNASVESKSD